MRAIVKFLAPASVALAAFSANAAGVLEIDYPTHQPAFTAPAQGAGSSAAAYQLNWEHSESAPTDAATRSTAGSNRGDAMRKAVEPGRFDLGFFA